MTSTPPAGQRRLSLTRLFTFDGLLRDDDGDEQPDGLAVCLVAGERAALPEHLVVCDLAARLGFATLALRRPVAILEPAGIFPDAIPIYVGRPETVPASCPRVLRERLQALVNG